MLVQDQYLKNSEPHAPFHEEDVKINQRILWLNGESMLLNRESTLYDLPTLLHGHPDYRQP